jgi:hypothetical protein
MAKNKLIIPFIFFFCCVQTLSSEDSSKSDISSLDLPHTFSAVPHLSSFTYMRVFSQINTDFKYLKYSSTNFLWNSTWKRYQFYFNTSLLKSAPQTIDHFKAIHSFELASKISFWHPKTANLGVLFNVRLPFGVSQNIPGDDYQSYKIAYGAKALFSLKTNIVRVPISTHFNIGYFNHNDKNSGIYSSSGKEFNIYKNTSIYNYSIGATCFCRDYNFSIEMWGKNFIAQPHPVAFDQENYRYLSFTLEKNHVFLNFDVNITRKLATSSSQISSGTSFSNLNSPQYRILLGI